MKFGISLPILELVPIPKFCARFLALYEDMRDRLFHYDTSDYPPEHKLYSKTNAKVLGKFKDECHGTAPLEFVGLRSKMYSLLMKDDVKEEINDENEKVTKRPAGMFGRGITEANDGKRALIFFGVF